MGGKAWVPEVPTYWRVLQESSLTIPEGAGEEQSCVSLFSFLPILHSGQAKTPPSSSHKPLLHTHAHPMPALHGNPQLLHPRDNGHQKETLRCASAPSSHSLAVTLLLSHPRRLTPPVLMCQDQGQEKYEMQDPTVFIEKYL